MAAVEKLPRVLSTLEKGQWALRTVSGAGGSSRSLCVSGNVRPLVILRGGKGRCELFLTEDKPKLATYTYSCDSGDQGLTRIRPETSKLMVIDTQGISNGTPFQGRIEARHSGGC